MLAYVENFRGVLPLNEKIEGEAQQTLVLFSVGCSRRTEKRDPQDIAQTGEPVLGLRQYGHAVSIFTKICELHEDNRVSNLLRLRGGNEKAYLVSANFELGCIPRRVLVRRTSDVTPGCLVRRYVTVNVERQLDCDSSVRVVGRNNITSGHLHFKNSWRSCQSTSALNTN